MAPKKQWRDLSPRTRRLITVGVTLEAVLKITALIDLKRRPAAEIRGSKKNWALAIGFINSVGAVPMAYFLYGGNKSAPR